MFQKKIKKLFKEEINKTIKDLSYFDDEYNENEKEINDIYKKMKEKSLNKRVIRDR